MIWVKLVAEFEIPVLIAREITRTIIVQVGVVGINLGHLVGQSISLIMSKCDY
jgi:hypothetical protein